MNRTLAIATLIVPVTTGILMAQEQGLSVRSTKIGDEAVAIAQGGFGMIGVPGEPANVRFITHEFSFNGRTVTNAPYSADEKTESVQTLADGTKITNTTTARVYRDSQGRTRREMPLPLPGGESHTLITINDPVAGTNYTLDPEMKVAHQMPMMMQAASIKMNAEAEARAKDTAKLGPGGEYRIATRAAKLSSAKREDLGTNVFEGVSATGTREKTVIESGAIGNDRPITITSERWISPDLQIEVKSVHDDPRMGQTTHTLTNISRAEPDASLFQVPSDYKLDEGKVQRFEFHSEK